MGDPPVGSLDVPSPITDGRPHLLMWHSVITSHISLVLIAASALALPTPAQIAPGRRLSVTLEPKTALLQYPHDVLVILADDLGIDTLLMYGRNMGSPSTPNIDHLAASGLRFDNAWAYPVCSATRAILQTGEYGCRTGIGDVIGTGTVSLSNSPNNLACLLRGERYSTAAFGKWHLTAPSEPTPDCTPIAWGGYDEFFGALGFQAQYCQWASLRVTSGSPCSQSLQCADVKTAISPDYMTTVVGDEASSWIWNQSGNWFAYFAPQAPYSIAHVPPSSLHTQTLTGTSCSPAGSQHPESFYAALQALDTKIGDLLAALGPNWLDTTTIFFIGDNGNPKEVNDAIGYWPAGRGKETLFEAGVHVPFLVAGKAVNPALRGSSSSLLVHAVDVYPTALGIAGATPPNGIDGVSLLPILAGQNATPVHDWLYAEKFSNTSAPPGSDNRAWTMRDDRYKLIHLANGTESFYDLVADPTESNDLGAPGRSDPGIASYRLFKNEVPCP